MERIIDVSQYIYNEYKRQSGEAIDEMKLHKLLYLAQRECLAITGSPLFGESFEGWKYGPVSKEVRMYYTPDGMYYKGLRKICTMMNLKTRRWLNDRESILGHFSVL